jgi:hypothetical protein
MNKPAKAVEKAKATIKAAIDKMVLLLMAIFIIAYRERKRKCFSQKIRKNCEI